MRGQGYDGAANMAGKYRGVQARVRNILPGAICAHCKTQNLNLSIIHVDQERYEHAARNCVYLRLFSQEARSSLVMTRSLGRI